VAIDVARILTRTPRELGLTDISPVAQAALETSGIRKVTVLARRGPLQAKCTPVELRELSEMEGASLVVDAEDMELDPASAAELEQGTVPTQNQKVYAILKSQAGQPPDPGKKIIHMRFNVSPTEILGQDQVEGVRVRRNRLTEVASGQIVAAPTAEAEVIPAAVVFRSIGYLVAPVKDVPYDAAKSQIPHVEGQVLDGPQGSPIPGLFVAGWAKRGPSGVIGTNKPDAAETVRTLLAAYGSGGLPHPQDADVTDLLSERGVRFVTYDDWKTLDALEVEAGASEGRPRIKFADVPSMLAALARA
jgi:ferredoxin--NADP+ reductase